MMNPSKMSTLDRLRLNVPVSQDEYRQRSSRLAAWGGGTLIIALTFIMVCAIGGCHAAHGSEPQMEAFRRRYDQPVVVQLAMFASPGCKPCNDAANDARAGRLPGVDLTPIYYNSQTKRFDDQRWQQFGESFAQDDAAFQKAYQSGQLELSVLPKNAGALSYPIFWFPGSTTYRIGYESSASHELTNWALREAKAYGDRANSQPMPQQPQPQLNASVNGVVPFGDGNQAAFQMQMNQASYPQQMTPQQLQQMQQMQGQPAKALPPQEVVKPEDFDGVSLVLVIGDISDIVEIPFIHRFITKAVDNLREKIHAHVSDKIRVRAIAKQFSTDEYNRVVALTCDPPDPFRLYLLIPQRSKGFQGFFIEKIKSALVSHVTPQLQNININPLLEKESAKMFEGIQDIAFTPKPATPATPEDPWGPHRDQIAVGTPLAWITSKLRPYQRLRGLLGYQVT